jgi:uncharacterized membrane-anchored protein YjiN (DUF445 family)
LKIRKNDSLKSQKRIGVLSRMAHSSSSSDKSAKNRKIIKTMLDVIPRSRSKSSKADSLKSNIFENNNIKKSNDKVFSNLNSINDKNIQRRHSLDHRNVEKHSVLNLLGSIKPNILQK